MTTDGEAAKNFHYSIEPATWRDLNSLRYVERVCFPKDYWPLWDLIGVLTLPKVIRLKAVVQDTMVGFIASDIRSSERLAWIATVAVLPEYRGRGIGTALITSCEIQVGVPAMRLTVRASNKDAIRLYRELGYEQKEVWRHYYQDGEDGIIMEKRLQGND